MTLSHQEIQELLGAYALDAVDPDEAEAIDLHLRECPRCRTEVAEHREIAAMLAHSGAPAPAGIWDRIAATLEPAPPELRLRIDAPTPTLGAAPPDQPGVAPPGGTGPRADDDTVVPLDGARRRRGPRALLWLSAAAVLLAALLGADLYRQTNRLDKIENRLDEVALERVAEKAAQSPGATTVQLASTDEKLRTPVALGPNGSGYLFSANLPPIDRAHTYQLWGVLKNDTVVSLGTFPSGTEVVPFRVDGSVTAFAVTEEVAGGVVASTQTPVVSGPV